MSTDRLRAAATGAVQQTGAKPKHILDYLEMPQVKQGIAAVAGKFLTPERMLTLCVNAVKKTPKLALCDPKTVLGAMMTSSALGLEPNTVQQQAFLIPYKTRALVDGSWRDVLECQFQIGARGFVTLAYRSPAISRLEAHAIHAGDTFRNVVGSKSFLEYEKKLLGDRGTLVGAFSYAMLADGRGETACVLPLDEIEKIRARSETYRALMRDLEQAQSPADRQKAERKLAETPWIMWADDMASKSALKKHAKQLPVASSDLLLAAADVDDRSDAGILDLGSMTDPDTVRAVVNEGMDPPALEHAEPPPPVSSETFGNREDAPVPREGDSGAPPAGKTPARGRRAASAPADGAEPAGGSAPGAAAPPPAGPAKPGKTYAQLADEVQKAPNIDAAIEICDEARSMLPPDQAKDLGEVFRRHWQE
jgi:recombination protein RecT